MNNSVASAEPSLSALRGRMPPATYVSSPLKGSKWLGFLVVSVCLAFSACYELVEWLTAVSSGAAADDFLGTQGDPWDTQTDMAMALVGALVAVAVMTRWHDRSMARLAGRASRP